MKTNKPIKKKEQKVEKPIEEKVEPKAAPVATTIKPQRAKNPKKVILLGKGEGWEQCPENTDAEIWGLNGLIYGTKKLDRVFMMDILDEMPSIISGTWDLKETIARINELDIPMVAPYKYVEIPKSEAFPLDESVREFGTPYFNNTIAFMIAYALLRGVHELHLWGINQASGSEYFYEKGCVEYWLGIATGMGVTVAINGKFSELLSNKQRYGGDRLYGYNMSYNQIVKVRNKFGETVVKKLIGPSSENRTMYLGPEKSKGLRTVDILGVKQLWTKFANHPEAQWILSLNDAYNLARFVIEKRPKHVLDLGTGIGCSSAVIKYANPESKVTSIEQYEKCVKIAQTMVKGVDILRKDAEVFELAEIPGQKLMGYKDIPADQKFDMVVIDGPGDFVHEGVLVRLPSADIFRILDQVNEDAVVYIDQRVDTVNLIARYLNAFLTPVIQGNGFTVFRRTKQKYDKKLVVDQLLNKLKKLNYF